LDKSFIKIAKSVGLIFQEDSIKQSTLFIHGPSDSGKTLLLANILLEYFGSENVGSMVSAKNFK
jgi:polynucleotide 5'-kinase involved in rRNA processing